MKKPKIGGKIGAALTLLEMGKELYDKYKKSKKVKKTIKKQKKKEEKRKSVLKGQKPAKRKREDGKVKTAAKEIAKGTAIAAGGAAAGYGLGKVMPDSPLDIKMKKQMEREEDERNDAQRRRLKEKNKKKKKVIKYPPPKKKKKKIVKYPPPKKVTTAEELDNASRSRKKRTTAETLDMLLSADEFKPGAAARSRYLKRKYLLMGAKKQKRDKKE